MIARDTDAEVRYLVAEVLHVGEDDRWASLTNAREYRTLDGAEARRDALAAEGKVAVLQVGVIEWLDEETASERMTELQEAGVTWR